MGKAVDSIIAYRILKLLVTPFNKTDAFKLGIIDEKGNELKKIRDLHTTEDRDAYTLLHRLVFRLKKIIEKVPVDNKKFLSLAAAYALIREQYDLNKEPIDLEVKYINKIEENLSEELILVEDFMSESRRLTFRQFVLEDGEGAPAAAPANNAAATPGIAGLDRNPPISKKAQKKWTTANAKGQGMFTRCKPKLM
jgi:hypothetical protein